MQTRDQVRAKRAYECIKKVEEKDRETYGRCCLNFPALLFTCGLAQAVAFYQSKEHNDYLTDVLETAGIKANDIFYVDVSQYQAMTMELIAVVNWFKRYAEAILKVKQGQSD